MNILIVSQYYWPENFRINDLSVSLVERGHRVTVLTGTPNYPDGKFFPGHGIFKQTRAIHHGVNIVRMPLVPRGKGSGIQLAINYFTYAFFASVLGPVYCREKYDLIFVCQLSPVTVGLPALFLKTIKRAPILFWILDLWPESVTATGAVTSPRIRAALDWLVEFIYKGCDKIIVASHGFIESVKSKGINIDRNGYLPNWYEPEYKATGGTTALKPHPELPKGFLVMFAGALGVAQDFESILTVAERLKLHQDIHWIILGDGRKFDWVKEQISVRGLTSVFHLLGRKEAHEMASYFACADVMLVTLKKDPAFALTVPGKIQSYMACGRPIVAALDGEGGKVVAESGAGFSSQSEDVNGLADSILRMYAMPKHERETMGRCGQEYCEANFERDMLIDRLEGWMRELTSREPFVEMRMKRAVDLLLSLMGTVALSVPMLLVALLVKLTSPGPVLYWSKRIGRNNGHFSMPKFRTMRTDTPAVATHLLDDPKKYLTPVGNFLRKSSLDELPQLLNVLMGEMSLIGPRPALFNQDDLITLRTQKGVHRLTPGLTGWAQINGRDELPIPQKVDLDEYYLNNRSMKLETKILLMTFLKVVRREGVTH